MPRPDGSPAWLDKFRDDLNRCTNKAQVHRLANANPGPVFLTRRMRARRNAIERRLEEIRGNNTRRN